jgi:hypothetical protein
MMSHVVQFLTPPHSFPTPQLAIAGAAGCSSAWKKCIFNFSSILKVIIILDILFEAYQ